MQADEEGKATLFQRIILAFLWCVVGAYGAVFVAMLLLVLAVPVLYALAYFGLVPVGI